ncbi:rhodanese-like domain-containing protein [Acidaminobacter sp. JC074]|uniref:rhodanese-like domain-containing protein n=1 Tax=Acidaminobacter sp. JC074 TaxID=2530199 RepID=UPI001F0D149C|nr:rhodanese-like domain-containing protein [Acidaminobacter sp. JC074]MCH4887407.1 rhodanese-like domain-containing protein [Acidaminobacter sp. JC074]
MKFTVRLLVITLLMSLVLVSCSSDAIEYETITAEAAKELMVEGNIILDVRTQMEYDEGHIENATLLPLDQINAGEVDILEDKNQVILVYCRSGNRSAQASKALVELGYTNVKDFGGIINWPYEVVKD